MDGLAIVRAAIASNEDAELRVYADWLETQGDVTRAQLIHLQAEAATLSPLDQRALELGWEIETLLAEHGERWRAELPALDGVAWDGFHRGFVCSVRVRDVGTLARHAAAIAAAAPVTEVELETYDDIEGELPAMPWLQVLTVRTGTIRYGASRRLGALPRTVRLVGRAGLDADLGFLDDHPPGTLDRLVIRGTNMGREFAQELAAAPWASALKVLELPTVYVDDNSGYYEDPTLRTAGARSLARLRTLESLDVGRQQIGGQALGKLINDLAQLHSLFAVENGCKKLPAIGNGARFRALDLSRNAIGTEGARAIAAAPRMAELQMLALDTCEIESIGLASLVRSPCWQTLRVLDLSRNPLGASAVRTLGDAPPPGRLHTLILADADLDETAGNALAKVAWLGRLSVLDLSGNLLGRGAASLRQISPDHLRRLGLAATGIERTEATALARFWPRLVELDLSHDPITDAGLERFATMKEAASLQTLRLRDCKLTDDGIELLARARCPRLRTLDLGGNAFGSMLEQLLRAPVLARVEQLDLASCALSADTAAVLAATPLPPRLRHLNLRGNHFDEATLVALADSPALRGITLELDGNPWTFAPTNRDALAKRFGATWYQRDDD